MVLSKEKEQEYVEKVKKDGLYLKRIKKNQTETICLAAVKQHGWALEFVKNQTSDICFEAVKKDGWVLQVVNEQTHEICLEAVKNDPDALEFVKEQTPEICFEAIRRDGNVIYEVETGILSYKIIFEALKENVRVIGYDNRIPTFEEILEFVLYCSPKDKEFLEKYDLFPDLFVEGEFEEIHERVTQVGELKSYRFYRYAKVSNSPLFNDSPYHVLECLYDR